jgi:predicted SAM-dependent methyltransferase
MSTPAWLQGLGPDRLHVGGTRATPGWKLLNVLPIPGADYIGDLRDLAQFQDASFDVVYASHVLEHLGYQRDLPMAIRGISRILRPGGRFLVSVPDLDVLCRLFLHEQLTLQDRFLVMRMMFGGQMDQHDFHFVGLNQAFLGGFLAEAGFQSITRVPEFGLFEDTSSMKLRGVPISLNLVAVR